MDALGVVHVHLAPVGDYLKGALHESCTFIFGC